MLDKRCSIDLNRRSLIAMSTLLALGAAFPSEVQGETGEQHMSRMMSQPPADAPSILMLIFPKMAALDLIGPLTVFTILRCNVQLAWKDKLPVMTDVRLPFVATHDFAESERCPDVLCVPGGIMGTIECMNDPAVCTFLAERGAAAQWVTSVCTGSLALAASGLLNGYKATSHWAVADLLPIMGSQHVDQRVVVDRNRITGGGVTAGIDFGLALAAKLKGEEAARRVQLIMEYAPKPPFQNGTPLEAGPRRTADARATRKWMDSEARRSSESAALRLGLGRERLHDLPRRPQT